MSYRFILPILCLIAIPMACAVAQDVDSRSTVGGYVTDSSTGETLLHANVVVVGEGFGAATNNAGFYVIPGLDPGRYTIAASYIGYRSTRKEVIVRLGQDVRLDFALDARQIETEEVVVTAASPHEEEASQIGVSRMPTRLVTSLPTLFEADLFRSLQLLPGIKAANEFSSGLYIRGGSPDQTLILLDRTTVYNPTHFFGLFSTFNPDALKDVQVYKGTYPAEYGGRLGSVIDIYNKDGNREELRGRMSLGLLASRVHLEGPFFRGSWMLAARRSTLEPVLAALRASEKGIPDTFYFYDVNGKVNYDPGSNDRLSLAFYGGTDKVVVEPLDDLRLRLPYGNRTASLTWTRLFSPRFFSSFTITGSRYFSLPNVVVGGTSERRRNQVFEASFKGEAEYSPNERHLVEMGVWGGDLLLKWRDHFDDEETLDIRTRTGYGVVYLHDTWRPSSRWSLRGGLRLNAFGAGRFVRAEPRLSTEYKPSDRLRLQAAYGRYYQYLTLITNEAFSGMDVWLAADEDVPPAWGDQMGAGARLILSEVYRLDAEVYYRTMEDLFAVSPYVQDPSGLDYADLFQFGDGYAYGAELMLEKGAGRLTGFAGYSFGRSKRRFEDTNRGRFYPPKYDRTHDFTAVVDYDLSERWRTTIVFNYHTGQAYTQLLGRTYYDDPFSRENPAGIVVGRVNDGRLPAYHRLDVGVTRTGRFFGLADYELQLQAINVYNRRNVWFYDFEFDDDVVERESIRMLPVLPNLSFTLTF